MLVVGSSCNKDEDSAEKFSTLSVEANKAVVEASGTDFVKVMTRMQTIQTVDLIAYLGDLMSSKNSTGFLFSQDSKIAATLNAFTSVADGEKEFKAVFDAMISSKGLIEDPESLKEFWDSNVGTYTWNKTISDWNIALGGDKFIFKFPSSNVATTNDATFTVSNYTGVKISNPVDDEYTGDLPASINADLKVGTKTLITYVFAASYNSDGVPKAIASDLVIEGYKFEVDITNDSKVVSAAYKFFENDKVVMDMSASGKGLFTDSNYNANTVTHTETHGYYDWVWSPTLGRYVETWVTYTDEWKETDFEEIINSASVSFQLFNIALRGDISIKELVDQMKLIEKDLENKVINDETAQNRYAVKINEFLNLRLVDVAKNEIMAIAEAYVVKEINYGYTDFYINFRLKFSDGSPIDLETYFDKGFEDFIDAMNDLILDINSEHDLDISPIDY
jgi:hypothetical protein